MRTPAISEWKIIKARLKSARTHKKAKWWLKDDNLTLAAESTADAVKDIIQGNIPPHAKIIKRTSFRQTERKILFTINYPEGSEHSFVVKVFLGDRIHKAAAHNGDDVVRINLRYRLRCSRNSLNEAVNLLRADERHINTPIVYGYGRIKGALGLAKASVIILEYLGDSTVDSLLKQAGSEEECSRIFMCTVPLFASLFWANCNHIDVNSRGVILSEQNSKCIPYLLDFQHARFYRKPSFRVLMFEAGTFAKSCRSLLLGETIQQWLDEVLAAVGVRDTDDIKKMKEYFDYYLHASLSRKECKQIC